MPKCIPTLCFKNLLVVSQRQARSVVVKNSLNKGNNREDLLEV